MAVLHGIDSDKNLVPLLVDASGRPIVTADGTLAVSGSVAISNVVSVATGGGATDLGSVHQAATDVWDVQIQAGSAAIGSVTLSGTPTVKTMSPASGRYFAPGGKYSNRLGSATLSAGTNTFDSAAVSGATYAVVTNIGVYYNGTVSGVGLNAIVRDVGADRVVAKVSNPTAAAWVSLSVWIVLFPGDYIRFTISGATAGDDGYLDYIGFLVI